MKGALSLLIQIAAFAGLVAVFLVPCLVADHVLGLKRPWPAIIGLGFLIAILWGLFRWLMREQRKEQAPVATRQHELFGQVKCFKDRWEATAKLNQNVPSIEISGDAAMPTSTQVSTFAAIQEQYSELLTRSLDGVREAFASDDFSLSSSELHLDGIYLSADDFGSFDLVFSVPAHKRKLPWGVTVQFADFNIDEISDNH
jgi:hypothetical protein